MGKCAFISIIVLSMLVAAAAGLADQYDIVINEIMYNPASDNADDEYLELFNRGATPVDLGGWRFTSGISFTIPAGTVLGAGQYLVIARNAAQATSQYGVSNVIGDYSGKLANEGERVALANASSQFIDEVTYADTPPWPVAPDGLGPSLELINPWADNKNPGNWRACGASEWHYVERTGTATSRVLYIYMLDMGECLIDDVSIVPWGGGTQHIQNGGFESGLSPWHVTGNHAGSYVTTEDSHSGASSMHLVSTGIGGSSSNSIYATANPSLTEGQTYTLSFWVKHVSGDNRLYSRLSGGGLSGETIMTIDITPGEPNTWLSNDIPSYIHGVMHTPQLPTSLDSVTVTAVVEDDSAVTQVILRYNEGAGWQTAPMYDDGGHGDGAAGDDVYGAIRPPRPSQSLVRYSIEAIDDAGQHESSPYPSDPFLNWGYFPYDNEVGTALPLYWIYADPYNLSVLDYDPFADITVPATFVADQMVYDGCQIGYRGESARWVDKKSWKVKFPKGNRYRGLKHINLNACYGDKSFLRERLSWQLFKDAGAAYCDSFNVRMHMNGEFYGLYAYVEHPNDDWLERIGRDPDGNLYKAYGTLEKLDSQDEYWETYEKKTNEGEGYQDIIDFIVAMNNASAGQIEQWLLEHVDIDSLINYQAANMLIHNNDQPHKNYYVYHDPASDKWEMFVWDLDLVLGRNYETSSGVWNDTIRYNCHPYFSTRDYPKNDGPWNRLIDAFLRRTPAFQKAYLTRLHELTDTLLTPDYFYPKIDQWTEEIRPEVTLDRERWGAYGDYNTWDLDYQKNILKQFVTNRHNLMKLRWLTINPGWNWVSFPLIPTDPKLTSIFRVDDIKNNMYRWDPVRKNIELYPDDFTTVEVGRGYLIRVTEGTYNTHYAGKRVASGAFEIAVPEAGWIWIGHPRTIDVLLSHVSVRDEDTGVIRTATEDKAAVDPWINWNWIYWNSYAETAQILAVSGGDETRLHPYWGYRVWANKGNLTLRMPSS